MNILCVTFSIVGLASGFVAYDNAVKWQKLSRSMRSKRASIVLVCSTFASFLHVWTSLLWREIGVALFPQWDFFPITYIASGLSVIIPSLIIIAFHVLSSDFISREIQNVKKSREAPRGYAR